MKITVIFPTKDESRYFSRKDVNVEYCGVGLIASTLGTEQAIVKNSPDLVIMGGIAGVYETSPFKVGDTVVVKEERVADLGFFYPDGFRPLDKMELDMSFDTYNTMHCANATEELGLPLAVANSMNCAMAPFADTKGVDIESMEGAAFFYVCKERKVPFLEVRAISNVVDLNREAWDYEGSIKNLTKGLNCVIDTILATSKSL